MFTQRLKIGQSRKDLLLGVIPNGTGIDKYGIGVFDRIAKRIACHLHNRSDHFAVGHIHLTAISLYKQFLLLSFFKSIFIRYIFHSICFFFRLILIYKKFIQKSNIFIIKICFLKNIVFLCIHIT